MNSDEFTEVGGEDLYGDVEPFSPTVVRRVKMLTVGLMGVLLVAAIPLAFWEGKRQGRNAILGQITTPQRIWLENFIDQHSATYSNVAIQESPDGYLFLTGDVPTKADRMLCVHSAEKEFGTELSAKMTRLLGIESWY